MIVAQCVLYEQANEKGGGVWNEDFEHDFHLSREKESEGACVMYKHAHAFMFERWAAVVVSHVR